MEKVNKLLNLAENNKEVKTHLQNSVSNLTAMLSIPRSHVGSIYSLR